MARRRFIFSLALAVGLVLFGWDPAASSTVGSVVRVSHSTTMTDADNESFVPAISDNGRFVAFVSSATNLIAGDANSADDVFVYDALTGGVERVSVATSSGAEGNGPSGWPSISADGRYVAFSSAASNLVSGDANGRWDVFVRDRAAGTTVRVSVPAGAGESNGDSYAAEVTPDGNSIAFHSSATNLVAGDGNGVIDVFVRNRSAATTVLASLGTGGSTGNGPSSFGSLSADGHLVAFSSAASNLVASDTNGTKDIFVRDLVAATTTRVSRTTAGQQAVGGDSTRPRLSADGRFVAFESAATNLGVSDTNGASDVFVFDRLLSSLQLVSRTSSAAAGNGSSIRADISASGRFVAFDSDATNLYGVADANGASRDAFVYDRVTGSGAILSRQKNGPQGNAWSVASVLSGDGSKTAFESVATNLSALADTNGLSDVFYGEAVPDTDDDGIIDIVDNCPTTPNPGQENTPLTIGNGTHFVGDDTTVPNDDHEGDACDSDLDNDGLANAAEAPLAACGGFDGSAPAHPMSAGGDNTFDDNGNGIAAPGMGSDVADTPPSSDTDGDGVLDGVECALGFNPRSAGSRPSVTDCGGLGDADGDGLRASWERCHWGTSDTTVDSDGDGTGDCREAADVDGDAFITFPGDVSGLASAYFSVAGADVGLDIDGDALITFPGDVLIVSAYYFAATPCQ